MTDNILSISTGMEQAFLGPVIPMSFLLSAEDSY